MAREFVTTGDLRIEEEIDLEDCKTDPIQNTAMIQPHGVFFQLTPEDTTILSCSNNLSEDLGTRPESVLGDPIESVVGSELSLSLQQIIEGSFVQDENFLLEADGNEFLASVFTVGETAGLELEPHEEPDRTNTEFLFRENTVLKRIRQSKTRNDLLDNLAGIVKVVTGYDRVIVLRFKHNGHGHVLAESKNMDMNSYMDQYFPASDIPEPARRIYRKNGLRYIPRADYDPVSVVDADGPLDRDELDLTYSDLRNVPIIHRKYLKNMGVGASMSIPLIVDNSLWGLITAHNTGDGSLHWHTRHLCSRIGKIAATTIERIEAERRERMYLAVEDFRDSHLKGQTLDEGLFEFIRETGDRVLELMDANAFFIRFNDRIFWYPEDQFEEPSEELQDWIKSELESESRIRVHSIADQLEGELGVADRFAGFFAMNITQRTGNYCVWFRPEQESEIKWGGDPRSPLNVDESNELNPRNSFEEWTQIVKGRCERWTEVDQTVAADLINMFNEVALEEQSGRLRAVNDELEEKNKELNKANERLEELSYYDELTGIPNRRQFEETLKSKWELLERNGQPMSLIMIDIDYFKEFNDNYGHSKGDECLQKVSRILNECARRESDTVARYGGEEFAVILPDTNREDAVRLAEKMREAVRDLGVPHEYSEIAEVVTISLGVVCYDELSDRSREDLVKEADEALYKAKDNGRDRVVPF